MTDQIRVNIRTVANMTAIRRERRNGRDKIIVPSATLPDDVIMNGIKYPAAEIAKSFGSLENKPAPLGHPTINGQFVSASDPEGINIGWIGAHNENVRQEKGRVFVDKVIDVARASESEGGRAVIEAINEGNPIHTSTGVFLNKGPKDDNDARPHEHTALNMFFDHDAILLGEEGAATPDQGVGIFVNSDGSSSEVEVINSTLAEDLDDQVEWLAENLASAMDRRLRLPAISEIKSAIMRAVDFKGNTDHKEPIKPLEPTEETNEMADDKQLEAVQNSLSELTTTMNGLGASIAKSVGDAVTEAISPVIEHQTNQAAAAEAAMNAEKAGYVETIVKANLMTEEVANTLSIDAAKQVASTCKPAKAAAINGAGSNAFGGSSDEDEFADVKLNAAIDAADGKKGGA